MEVLDVISSKLTIAQHFLKDLLNNYEQLDDTARMERSNIIMDNISSYLQIEQNLLFPLIEKTGEHADIIARACEVQNKMDEILERAVMVHVDEPDHVFYNNLSTLLNLLDSCERIDRDAIFPWSRVYLTEDDQFYIISQLRSQTQHESQPTRMG